MSDTTETATRRLRDDPVIDAVCREVEAAVGSPESTLAVRFAELFLARAAPDLLRQRTTAGLTRMILGAFDFLLESRPYRVDVSVTNPDSGEDGEGPPVTVIRTNVSERPFIVDTIREFLHARELVIETIVYPLFDVERDEDGTVIGLDAPGDGGSKESMVHCELARIADQETLDFIEAELTRRLQDVVRSTDDFGAMIDAVNSVVTGLAEHGSSLPDRQGEIAEIQDFMRWLRDGGFVFLGYRGYDLLDVDDRRSVVVETGSGLGVLRNEAESRFAVPVPIAQLPDGMRVLAERGPLLIISKTNAESTVHRRARMDYIGLKKLGPDGATVGEHRFVGLFTSRAFAENAADIPILRRKLTHILEEAGAREGSHDYKEIITIFNTLPKEELFLTSAGQIGDDIQTVLTSYNIADVRVTLREDPLQRGVSAMVILPRDRFSGKVRKDIEAALIEELDGEVLNYHLAMGEGDQARLHFYIATTAERIAGADTAQIEQRVRQIIRSWTDRVQEGLEKLVSSEEAHRLAESYGAAFTAEYQAATTPEIAVGDILELEDMAATSREVSIAFANHGAGVPVAGVEGVTELKVFLRGERLILSDFMPILEDAGLRVIAAKPFEVRSEGAEDCTVYTFAVQDPSGEPLDVAGRGELLSETILAAQAGEALSDSLNALVLTAGLHWREVDVLRAYAGYAFQIGAVPSRASIPSALVQYPGIARELFELFSTRFSPEIGGTTEERTTTLEDIRDAFQGSLRGVSLLADDRALRRVEELIEATQRTNFYRHGGRNPTFTSGGVPYVSFKFSCAAVDALRDSRLLFEVWVHSARMEGVHLRGANVARGGIRWSDRPDDFRTEIMGLVKTQVVKNAVIVPSGSKGGFITRVIPSDPEERFAEGRRQYETLQRGLLDLTDNLVEGRTEPPPGVISYDPPDPYLVVAADKGTATFSDIANGISAEYGFWLDDAFASGGSHGYDHKAVGITARGAWECVKRHFREKGKDIQSEPFTVVGIGDMSGDVFGNGMLLSEQIRLIAAFDHRHVFIDPDPDPASTFAERKRLFGLGRSSWADYDESLLSEGGMIVPRGSKEVELTPEARQALGLSDDEPEVMDGETLIRAVLSAPVELLWNGGIGTYVKASSETHSGAGDPSNTAVRVDVPQLRCEVVGEGGNLGFTQTARIEYALRGGRINTDALDNSAGVDMSDHEVNLKILLAPTVTSGSMTPDARNGLLEELTDSVADHVLENNRTQSLAISLDQQRAREGADDFRDLMLALERADLLDRASERLPSTDVLAERVELGDTLVRPELCVLLAYAKLLLKDQLLKSGLPDDPVADSYLLGYFPPAAMVAARHENLAAHRLRREIITSQLTNDLVDLMGATFVSRVMRDTGQGAEQIVRAWLVASRLADHRALLGQMGEQSSAMNVRVSYRWLLGLARVLERTTRWVLQNVDPDAPAARVVESNLEGLATLREGFADVVAGEERRLFEARVAEIQEVGADSTFSRRLMTLRFLDQLMEILEIARETGSDPVPTGRAYYAVSEAFEVPWLRRSTFAAAGDDQWEHRAAQALSEDLSRAHRKIVVAVMIASADSVEAEAGADRATAELLRTQSRHVERFQGIASELKTEGVPGLAAVSVAARELATLSDRLARTG
jgi:glutamate dehydrogenase